MKLLLLVCIIALAEGRRHPTLRRLEKPCRSEKKCRNCEGRCVKEETVQCLRDPCEDSPCGDKEMCVANYCGECSACCLKPKKCNKRSKTCKDGSEIFRDPFNNCKYPKCPEPVICTNDVFECADGTYLTRGGPNCEFPECPVPACAPKDSTTFFDPKTCQVIRFQCEEGFEYWGNPDCGCGCKPKVEGCPEDAFICPDGTSLSRDPANNCEFPKCPVPACAPEGASFMGDHKTCMLIDFICNDGFEHWFDEKCGCGCKPKEGCPKGQCADCDGKCIDQVNCIHNPCLTNNGGCAADEECVGSCACFKCGCKKRVCTEDAFICPDGTSLSRDPANNCEFPKCPATVPKCAPKGTTNYHDPRTCKTSLFFDCKDGFEHWSNSDCGCGCKPQVFCTQEVMSCPDGSFVSRDSKNGCAFPECPVPKCVSKGHTFVGTPESDKCQTRKYNCDVGMERWSDAECGCGCRPNSCPDGTCMGCDGKCTTLVRCIANPCSLPTGMCANPDEECVTDGCGCTKCGCEKRVCDKTTHICPDGTLINRDPTNNCEYPKCPEPVICTNDVFECADGTYLTRGGPNCEFPKCPEPVICTNDVFECADGTYLTRGGPNCEFPECPVPACAPKDSTTFFDPKTCQVIRFQCEEGFEYWGNPDCGCGCKPKAPACAPKDSTFFDPKTCQVILFQCEKGFEYWGNPDCGCGCKPKVEGCPEDAFICPDGTSLSRDPANNCEFPKCPATVPKCAPKGTTNYHDFKTCQVVRFECKDGFEHWSNSDCGCGCKPQVFCTQEVMSCPDGSFVSRDSKNGCAFPECPVPKCVSKGHTFVGTPESDKCQTRKYNCDVGMERWSDAECGCGCRPNSCPDGTCMGCDGKCTTLVRCIANPCSLPTGMCANPDEECVTDGCGCTKCGCEKRVCDKTTHICPDGTLINRDPTNNCEYPKCPSPVCPLDAKLCPNGQHVSRNPKNNCEFDPCVGDACTGCNKWLKCASRQCPKAPESCFGCCQKCVIGNDGSCTGVTPVEACPVNTI